jgi:hypothetical protein
MMTHWLFIIPLGMGLASGFYTLRSSDELNNSLIGTFTLICLLISLLIAPWELQLLIALLVIAAARYYWLQIDAKSDTIQPSVPPDLDFKTSSTSKEEIGSVRTYRGVAYEADSPPSIEQPTLKTKPEAPSPRIYRGVAYDNVEELVYALEKLAEPPPKKPRKYRGVSLPTDESESAEKQG